MARWKKSDFWMDAFRDALPMVLARIWMDANVGRVDRVLTELEPEAVLQWTGGSLKMEDVAEYLLLVKMPQAIVEAAAAMDSELGKQIRDVRHRKNFDMWRQSAGSQMMIQRRVEKLGGPLPDGWREDIYEEMQAMTAEHIRGSKWWEDNGTPFRRHANALRSVRKVQES